MTAAYFNDYQLSCRSYSALAGTSLRTILDTVLDTVSIIILPIICRVCVISADR